MARKQFRDGLAATAAEARADPLALYFGPAEPAAGPK
jgi:hypothetical protein